MKLLFTLIALLGLAAIGLRLEPGSISITGEAIEPIRYERVAAPSAPISVCSTTITQDGGRTGIPVLTACTVPTSTAATMTTAVTK